MSEVIFPPNPKISYSYTKRPTWNTIIKRSASGMECRATYYSTPIWEFEFPIYLIGEEDMVAIGGFLNLLRGAFDTFYFKDPIGAVVDQSFTGDGNTDSFQLYRNWNYWYTEYPYFPTLVGYGEGGIDYSGQGYGVPVWDTPYVYLNGVLQGTGYAISQTGLLLFDTAPGDGVAITATFDFYYLCRFKEDYIGLENFSYNLWKSDSVVLVNVKT